MLDHKCTFCGVNKWNATDGEHNPVFWKDTDRPQIHVKCYIYILEHPDDPKVSEWHFQETLETHTHEDGSPITEGWLRKRWKGKKSKTTPSSQKKED